MTERPPLDGQRVRLIVITDPELAPGERLFDAVTAALRGGAPAIQLRNKNATARELLIQARRLRTITRHFDALLFVNDRIDVALASDADGVHLGPEDVPVHAARAVAQPGFLIGASTDSPETAHALVAEGADYIGCGAVFGTRSKPGLEHEAIGIDRLDEVARAIDVPVVAIGGIHEHNVGEVATTGAAGAAVIRAVMGAADPAAAVRGLLRGMRGMNGVKPGR